MGKKNKSRSGDHLLTGLLNGPYLALNAQIYEALAEAGYGDLRPAHFSVFQHLKPGGSRATELAEHAQITKQSMGYLIEALEKQGYAEQIPDPTDGRARLVRLTERGEAVNRVTHETLQNIEVDWAKKLGKNKMQKLRHLLSDLSEEIGS